jgi:hypothetical protein
VTAHSRLGASSAKRWMTCPGSFRLHDEARDKTPGSGGSVYAAAGTVAHAYAEAALETGNPITDAIGQVTWNQGHEVVMDKGMAAAVQVYLDAIEARRRPGMVVMHEQRVCLDKLLPKPPPVSLFGTADTIMWDPTAHHLTVLDFKYGSGVFVQANDNPQLLYYGAGAWASLAPQWRKTIQTVGLVVVQPRAAGQEPVRGETIDILDLRRWVDFELAPAVEAVTQPDAPLVPGTHCRFCAAKPTCPARADLANVEAAQDFTDLSVLSL